jgi:hypothetical protein
MIQMISLHFSTTHHYIKQQNLEHYGFEYRTDWNTINSNNSSDYSVNTIRLLDDNLLTNNFASFLIL